MITEDFLFRFERQNKAKQEEKERDRQGQQDGEKFFECPGKCGRYLIEQQPSFVVDKHHGMMRMKLGVCLCGTTMCVRCHKRADDMASVLTHRCEGGPQGAAPDPASMALMAKLGKREQHHLMLMRSLLIAISLWFSWPIVAVCGPR